MGFTPSFVEPLLQAAQVINVQNALRIRAEQEGERLRLKEQYMDDLNKRAEEKNRLTEEVIALRAEAKKRDQDQRDRELDQREEQLEINRAAEERKSKEKGADDYEASLKRRKLELGVAAAEEDAFNSQVKKLSTRIDNTLARTPTGDKSIDEDPSIFGQTKEQLTKTLNQISDDLRGGSVSQATLTMLAKTRPEIHDPIQAAKSQQARIQKYMNWRTLKRNEQLEIIEEGAPNYKAAQFLMGEDYLGEAMSPRSGSVRVNQESQEQADETGQIPPNAPAGTVGRAGPSPPPSADVREAFRIIDTFSPEMLQSGDGVARAASTVYEQLRKLQAVNDRQGTIDVLAKSKAKSPALRAKLRDLLNANSKK